MSEAEGICLGGAFEESEERDPIWKGTRGHGGKDAEFVLGPAESEIPE